MQDDELVVELYGATANQLPGNILDVTILTSRGDIHGLLHPCEGESGAILWVGGAIGDTNGPAGGLYSDLSHELVNNGITSFRLRYRLPGEHQECVLDALASLSFLKGIGAKKIAVVGTSFGGAVAIGAGALSQDVTGVAALCSQRYGTHLVPNIAPRPLLLVHGMDDTVVLCAASQDIYDRAGEPKELVLYPGAGHGLSESRDELEVLLRNWLIDKVGNPSLGGILSTSEAKPFLHSFLVERPEGMVVKEAALFLGDITDVVADAIVCPTNEQLWMGEGTARAIAEKGGDKIVFEARRRAPAKIGSAVVIAGGDLKAKHVIMAVTGASYRLPDEESIRETTLNCLSRAGELGLRTIAFPALGTGSGGFSYEKAANLMVWQVVEYLKTGTSLEKVIFVSFNRGCFRAFQEEFKRFG